MRPRFDIGVSSECPHCKTGEMIFRRGKFGDFLGCSRYPSCAFIQSILQDEEELDDYIENNEESDLVFN